MIMIYLWNILYFACFSHLPHPEQAVDVVIQVHAQHQVQPGVLAGGQNAGVPQLPQTMQRGNCVIISVTVYCACLDTYRNKNEFLKERGTLQNKNKKTKKEEEEEEEKEAEQEEEDEEEWKSVTGGEEEPY